MSNWFPAEFTIDSTRYLTSEHYMMAQKAKLFNDQVLYDEILKSKTPREAQILGRKVCGFNIEQWKKHRVDIVVAGNEAQFSQNQPLRNYLLSTGDKILVEASPDDRIWGIGMAENYPLVEDPTKWQGTNLLGFALMEVRCRLKIRKHI